MLVSNIHPPQVLHPRELGMATYHRYGDGREGERIAENVADAKPRHSACFGFNDLAGFAYRS